MTFFHYFIIFILLALFTAALRLIQLQTRVWIEIYVFVFVPLLAFSIICLLIALADVKQDVFLDIGRFLIIHSLIGLALGFGWSIYLKRF